MYFIFYNVFFFLFLSHLFILDSKRVNKINNPVLVSTKPFFPKKSAETVLIFNNVLLLILKIKPSDWLSTGKVRETWN